MGTRVPIWRIIPGMKITTDYGMTAVECIVSELAQRASEASDSTKEIANRFGAGSEMHGLAVGRHVAMLEVLSFVTRFHLTAKKLAEEATTPQSPPSPSQG